MYCWEAFQANARQQVNQWQVIHVHNTNSKAVASSRGHCCWSHHQQSSMLNFHASCGSAPSRSEAATANRRLFWRNTKTWYGSDSFTGRDLICLSRLNLHCLHKDTESLCNGRFILCQCHWYENWMLFAKLLKVSLKGHVPVPLSSAKGWACQR